MKRTLLLLVLFLPAASVTQAQKLDYSQRSYLKDNAYTIHPDETMSKASWEYLVPHITDKRIVLLGEFTHGAKEIFLVRNGLIRFLHEQLGFNTILFESGIGELLAIDMNRKELNPSQMTAGFFGGWRTKENRDLLEYAKKTNMSVAGFDVQRTGNSFKQALKNTARKQNMDTAFCGNLEDRYGIIQRELTAGKAVYDSVSLKTNQLIADYQLTLDKLSVNKSGNFSREHLFCQQTIVNRMRFLQYMLRFVKDRDWNSRWAARDSAMADNIRWLASTIYKNEKLVVVGHNFHIAKYNEKEKVMGAILRNDYPSDMYSLGVFAGSGAFADNSGKETKMLPPDSINADLKNIITTFKGFTTYLHIPENKVDGTEWLHQYIIVNDTFIDLGNSNKMILAKGYDGLLLLKKVSLPEP